ncbi:Mitogen-activated protein kinase kinase kinase YODA [Linum perenne]
MNCAAKSAIYSHLQQSSSSFQLRAAALFHSSPVLERKRRGSSNSGYSVSSTTSRILVQEGTGSSTGRRTYYAISRLSRQLFLPNSGCSPECSSIPSHRMTSPGPSSRLQSHLV